MPDARQLPCLTSGRPGAPPGSSSFPSLWMPSRTPGRRRGCPSLNSPAGRRVAPRSRRAPGCQVRSGGALRGAARGTPVSHVAVTGHLVDGPTVSQRVLEDVRELPHDGASGLAEWSDSLAPAAATRRQVLDSPTVSPRGLRAGLVGHRVLNHTGHVEGVRRPPQRAAFPRHRLAEPRDARLHGLGQAGNAGLHRLGDRARLPD